MRRKQHVLNPVPHAKHGYRQVVLTRSGERRSFYVHTLVMLAHVGPRPDGMEICHGPRGKLDNGLSNLRYDTPSENSRDTVRDGNHSFARRQVCPRDHPLVMPNLVRSLWEKRGYRDCLACNRARTFAKNRARRTGEVIDWVALSHSYFVDLMDGEAAA